MTSISRYRATERPGDFGQLQGSEPESGETSLGRKTEDPNLDLDLARRTNLGIGLVLIKLKDVIDQLTNRLTD